MAGGSDWLAVSVVRFHVLLVSETRV